ncbi:hypothetical protein DL764_004500 [Monosporascus ibericus]|uniref:Heterokaryon incompatibility domain-containing protein n=1 Tax=Monosporascus ibericus TaxID=155417 RepID=A0A4Q4TF56_9PEZI|nr:hypothetical protein DL764_004500 [Monosporascus ibericus]
MVAPSQQLPSRLLDLGDNKLRLECDVQSILGLRYATLSHVWGNDPASYLQLKEATLKAFKTEVPFDAIPVKYKDAIRITRALRIRYLWIDSLCIIQDSPNDWKTEALKMAAVYGCSACNISYTHAPSEEAAKRYLRDPRVNIPFAVVVQPIAGTIHGSWSTEAYRKVCSLLSRAWVFQERLLCPRTVSYGHDRLLWDCCETFNDEFSGPMPYVPRSKAQIYSAFSGLAQNQTVAGSLGYFNDQWKSMVNDYRSCKLTFEKDRAIAFAGIARAVQSQTGMTYLAGIWKEAAHLDLLWCAMPRGPKSGLRLPGPGRQERPKAPSWSWFTVPCQLSPDYDVVDYGLSTIAAPRSKETVYHASVLSFGHPKLPAEPEALFYDFDGLGIRLSTYKVPAGLRWENDVVQLMPHGQPMLPKKLDIFPKYDPRTAMKCSLDDLSLSVTEELPKNASMILLVFKAYHENRKGSKWYMLKFKDQVPKDNEEASDWWTEYQFSGLVIVPEEGPPGDDGSWKRIGVYMFIPRLWAILGQIRPLNPNSTVNPQPSRSITMAWRSSGTSNQSLVENLWRNKLITQPLVKEAFLKVDRAHYAPLSPYEDSPQPIGHHATISAPHMHASAVESLLPFLLPKVADEQSAEGVPRVVGQPGRPRRVLDIGSGSGYLTHVLAELVGEDGVVVGLEHIKELRDIGEANMRKSAEGARLLDSGRVRFRVGDGRKGWSEPRSDSKPGVGGPADASAETKDELGGWDAIHVGAAAAELHEELVQQLRSPGRMFIPVGDEGGWDQYIWTVDKDENGKIEKKKLYGVRYVPLTDAPK